MENASIQPCAADLEYLESLSTLLQGQDEMEDHYPFGESSESDLTAEDVRRARKANVIAALREAFSDKWFNISPIGSISGYRNDSPAKSIINELHCRDFSAMPMDVRVVLYRAVMQCIRMKVPSLCYSDFPFPENLKPSVIEESNHPESPGLEQNGSRQLFAAPTSHTIYHKKQIVFGVLIVIVAILSALAFLTSGHPSGTESVGYSSQVIEPMRVAPGIASAPVAPPQPIAQPEVHRAPTAEPAH